MVLSKDDALTAAREILQGPRAEEQIRLERLARALRPSGPADDPRVEIPSDAPPAMRNLARKASTNFMPLVVDTFSQVMKVEGYYTPGSADNASPWQWWVKNRFGARQTGVHRAALQYGVSYVTCLPGDSGPVMRGVSPRAMTALYQNPADDEWPMLALHVDGDQILLYDEVARYRFGMENAIPRSSFGYSQTPAASTPVLGGQLTYIDHQIHDTGVCPVVRYRDRMLLDGEEQFGIIEPLLAIQDRIDETTFGMLVTQYFQAFRQRYIIGWVPESEQEFLSATASDVWTFDDENVKVGELGAADPKGYIESKASAIRDLSAIGQVPAQNLGVDGISNISDATLAGLETGKNRKADEITTSLGESHEQALRLCAFIAGDEAAAADYSGEVRWKDAEARSLAATVDALVKQVTSLGVPAELVWEDIPGWSQQKVERATTLARRAAATQRTADMAQAAAAARQNPQVADLMSRRGNAG